MTDLFADFVTDEWIDRVFAVMALAPQHTFQVLTKRAARMQRYLTQPRRQQEIDYQNGTAAILGKISWKRGAAAAKRLDEHWPLPNVWLGVSAEDQERADERIPLLLQTPAAVRFVSVEPQLGPVDLTRIKHGSVWDHLNALTGEKFHPEASTVWTKIKWVIVGGESGPGARPFNVAWARSIIAQCKAAGVACFVKQLGAHIVDSDRPGREADGSLLRLIAKDKKGGDMSEWSDDLRVREFPK